jgi:hypothetical protein
MQSTDDVSINATLMYIIVNISFAKRPTNTQGSSGFLLIRSKFSTPIFFGIWLPSSGGRECLISHTAHNTEHCFSSLLGTHDPFEDGNHMPKHIGVENLERMNKNPLLPWVFVNLFANGTARCSVQPSRYCNHRRRITYYQCVCLIVLFCMQIASLLRRILSTMNLLIL